MSEFELTFENMKSRDQVHEVIRRDFPLHEVASIAWDPQSTVQTVSVTIVPRKFARVTYRFGPAEGQVEVDVH